MSELKTQKTDSDPDSFINSIDDESRRQDCKILLKMYQDITGKQPKMWGSSIVGFDQYHYKSERSTQEGDWPMVAFSPRKANLTLYFMLGFDSYTEVLAKLGKHKTSKGCLYINKLADVDIEVLRTLIVRGYDDMQSQYSS